MKNEKNPTIKGLQAYNKRVNAMILKETERCNSYAAENQDLRNAIEYMLDSGEIERHLPRELIKENEQMRKVIAAHADLWDQNKRLKAQLEDLEKYIAYLHGPRTTVGQFRDSQPPITICKGGAFVHPRLLSHAG